jgi:hypothetical protein
MSQQEEKSLKQLLYESWIAATGFVATDDEPVDKSFVFMPLDYANLEDSITKLPCCIVYDYYRERKRAIGGKAKSLCFASMFVVDKSDQAAAYETIQAVCDAMLPFANRMLSHLDQASEGVTYEKLVDVIHKQDINLSGQSVDTKFEYWENIEYCDLVL